MRPFKAVKYKAKRTSGYASKREWEYASILGAQKASGAIVDWLEQVPIKLPGDIKYVCDFLVINKDGTFRLVEIKGMETPTWKLKRRLLEESRPDLYRLLEVVR